jgi:hypothetical protein
VYYAALTHTESTLTLAARLLVGGAENPACIKRDFAIRAGIIADSSGNVLHYFGPPTNP